MADDKAQPDLIPHPGAREAGVSLVPRAASRPSKRKGLREAGVFIALLVMCGLIVASGARAAFLSPGNLQNLSRQVALLGVFAIGEAIVIIAGGIDLSVGSIIGISGMLCARMFAEWHWHPAAAITSTLLASLLIGVVHASLIQFLRMPPFIVTLGSLSILRSVSHLMSASMPISITG